MSRWSQLRARFWEKLGALVTSGPSGSPLLGARRHGRVCVGVFTPPDAAAKFEGWKDANAHLHGPEIDWYVDMGRAADGRDFVMVWVPAEYANAQHPM